MIRRRATLVSALIALSMLLAGCAATSEGHSAAGRGLGSVPSELVALYDQVDPQGTMELELDRDGAVIEMEADVPISALPDAVVAAARERYPFAEFTGAEREVSGRGEAWEVKLHWEGRAIELVIDGGGTLVEWERELRAEEAPEAVMEAAAQILIGSFASVEENVAGGRTLYHVKSRDRGASYKIVLREDGRVLRHVREQHAEIEIPLSR